MDGVGRIRVLAVWSPDPVMSLLAPVGLASAAGTALVIDRVRRQPQGTGRTLFDVVNEGPRLDEISPGRPGVATIGAGSLGASETHEAAQTLASRWPAVVVRAPSDAWPGPIVPVHVLYGGAVLTWDHGPAVWQPVDGAGRAPGPGPMLPRVAPRMVRHILRGWLPGPGRWTRAWRQVWGIPWA
ncbi:MAG: hypothetical protein R3258_06290 [Acidimicrobiia bacterium]|nr:hypothetical protein [Acidimicrobiia bacterium]